ncbi:hypothetical protein [Mycolicibacterium palauense]|uniref:hypothetical protein n=1 Tax=Mycolicibacterium palauense TaxID=2034511 RepID=UPI001FE860E7|nr:hypothetical protein [Mycolicibacterium palauense]
MLDSAAFGPEPGRWPLPAACTPRQRWLRAVAAGAQGYYAIAHTELSTLLGENPAAPWVSLAHSTRGSLLRQLGGHAAARGHDGRALAEAEGESAEVEVARADALIGLAADALGLGRLALSAALLDRAERALTAAGGETTRPEIRLHWVRAELAMAAGAGEPAIEHARRAAEVAGTWSSVRHRVKSEVVTAAALCCAGRTGEARRLADGLLGETADRGLLPLRWAVASLLDGIGSATYPADEMTAIRDEAAAAISRRGGCWAAG